MLPVPVLQVQILHHLLPVIQMVLIQVEVTMIQTILTQQAGAITATVSLGVHLASAVCLDEMGMAIVSILHGAAIAIGIATLVQRVSAAKSAARK